MTILSLNPNPTQSKQLTNLFNSRLNIIKHLLINTFPYPSTIDQFHSVCNLEPDLSAEVVNNIINKYNECLLKEDKNILKKLFDFQSNIYLDNRYFNSFTLKRTCVSLLGIDDIPIMTVSINASSIEQIKYMSLMCNNLNSNNVRIFKLNLNDKIKFVNDYQI